jgi:hypothetical protein
MVDELPFFLQEEALKPFISIDLMQSTTPITTTGTQIEHLPKLIPLVTYTVTIRDWTGRTIWPT